MYIEMTSCLYKSDPRRSFPVKFARDLSELSMMKDVAKVSLASEQKLEYS